MRFAQEYQNKVEDMNLWKSEVEQRTKDIMKYHAKLPITVGNMVYNVISFEEEEVPAYAYQSDYKGDIDVFKPIWDKDYTENYGWCDFEDCARIFDLICNTILNKKGNHND